MSFILDALKKSEGERQRQAGPALFEMRQAAPRRGWPLWALALGVLLLANAIVLVWFLSRPPASVPAFAAAPAATTPVAPPPAAASAPASGAAGPGAPILPPATGTRAAPLDEEAFPPPPPSYLSGNRPNPADYEVALPRNSAGAQSVQAQRDAQFEPNDTPSLAELPPSVSGQLPPLRLDFHMYSPEASRRFVQVNGRQMREGDSLPEGVRLERITTTGVVMSFRGTRFDLERD